MLFIYKINCSVGSVPVHQFSLMLMFSKRFFFLSPWKFCNEFLRLCQLWGTCV